MSVNSYFTFADSISQARMVEKTIADKRKRIETNLKASLLINEKIVVRAYSAIESDITESILFDNKQLIDCGLIIPEYRLGSNGLVKEIDKYLYKRISKRKYLRKMEMAELFDSIEVKKEVDGKELSDSRSFCLALLLYRLALSPNDHFKPDIKVDDLYPAFEILFSKEIPSRNHLLNIVKGLFKNQSDAINLVQSVYFGVGAHFANASPVWTNEINPHRYENLKIWLTKQPDLREIKKEDLILAKKFGITNFLEENRSDIEYLNEVLSQNQSSERIINNLRVTLSDINELSYSDILDLRNTRQFKDFSQYLSENKSRSDYGVNKLNMGIERRKFNRRDRVVELSCTVLGFMPLIGIYFSLLPITVNSFFGKKSKSILSRNLPLYSYSEAIADRVLV